MAKITVGDLGGYIREQRSTAQISLRQLAKLAGVSNPYLSQIERGLRRPSAEILQQIAKALRISAEALYVQAGILEERHGESTVSDSVLCDRALTDRQKQVLLEIYDSFRRENDGRGAGAAAEPATPSAAAGAASTDRTRAGTGTRKPARARPASAKGGTVPAASTGRRSEQAKGETVPAASTGPRLEQAKGGTVPAASTGRRSEQAKGETVPAPSAGARGARRRAG